MNRSLTEGFATFFKNQDSTFCNVLKSLHYFEKILVVLKNVLNCLIFSHAVLEKDILREKLKVVTPSESTERDTQPLVSIFNNLFNPNYENYQAYHRNLFKRLPLEIDCVILKIFTSASQTLIDTAANSKQNCLLFHEVKELGFTSCVCKTREWPCTKLIYFEEDAKFYRGNKEKVLSKKWTSFTAKDTSEKLKCDCDACNFQKPYASQQPLTKRHQLVEDLFVL